MRVAVFGSKRQKEDQIKHIFDILLAHHVEILVNSRFYEYLTQAFDFEYEGITTFDADDFDAELILTIGGDGTFLHTATAVSKKDIPVLGINAGRLGFLADVTRKELDTALSEVLQGKYRIEHRSQLQLNCLSKAFDDNNVALNEIAILKQDTASMLTIHAYINNEFLTTYQSDGLIISTPTGSTAYSLSVGGPIMTPTTSSFLLIAIAPHSLSARPLVIDDDSVITLEIESRSDSFLISLDGRSSVFETGNRLTIEKAKHSIKVAKPCGHTFYGTLRDKLRWGVDPRAED